MEEGGEGKTQKEEIGKDKDLTAPTVSGNRGVQIKSERSECGKQIERPVKQLNRGIWQPVLKLLNHSKER